MIGAGVPVATQGLQAFPRQAPTIKEAEVLQAAVQKGFKGRLVQKGSKRKILVSKVSSASPSQETYMQIMWI